MLQLSPISFSSTFSDPFRIGIKHKHEIITPPIKQVQIEGETATCQGIFYVFRGLKFVFMSDS